MKDLSFSTQNSSNKMGRIIYQAIEEVLGRRGVKDTLSTAGLEYRIDSCPDDILVPQFQFGEVSRLQEALEEQYGKRSGMGLGLIWGRTYLRGLLHNLGSEMEWNDLSFRLMPTARKIRKGIEQFAGLMGQQEGLDVHVHEDGGQIFWSSERCPVCYQRKTDEPACQMTVGALSELMTWISGGRRYRVVETACIANGAPACVLEIDKMPLE